LAAVAPDELTRMIAPPSVRLADMSLPDIIESRVSLLTAYQDATYASQYRQFVDHAEAVVSARELEGGDLLVREIAITLARLMAYKDEYEVARLYAEPAFTERLREQFDGDLKIRFHLASAALFTRKDSNGRPRKRELGGWVLPLFRVLARFKGLRGTAFDPFGYMAERRMERGLITEYRQMMTEVLDRVDADNLHTAIELAGAAQEVRGYGPVKHAAFEQYQTAKAGLLDAFNAPRQLSEGPTGVLMAGQDS